MKQRPEPKLDVLCVFILILLLFAIGFHQYWQGRCETEPYHEMCIPAGGFDWSVYD